MKLDFMLRIVMWRSQWLPNAHYRERRAKDLLAEVVSHLLPQPRGITPMLDNIKVLDITQVVSGSFASMTLADMGAEVVKIERPQGGDVSRHTPPYVGDFSSYFISVNRNKKSVSLDLKSEDGRSLFLDLSAEADVIVENFTPGTMAKLGVDYETVSKRSPAIIYCSITGFGQDGPYASYPALDIIAQAMSGNMSITGSVESQPYRSGIPIADIAGSMYAVQGILGALYQRARSGEGQHLDISMLDSIISWLTVRAGFSFATEKPYPRMGNKLEEFVPYGVFETSDSYLAVVVVQDHHWEKLCEAIDRPGLAVDERFRTADRRRTNRDELEAILERELSEQSTDEWFDQMTAAGVPAGPVYDTKEIWEDEHVRARGMRSDIDTGDRQFPVVNHPIKSTAEAIGHPEGVPRVGENTRSTLAEMGHSRSEIDDLIERGVVGTPETSHPDR